MIFEILSTENDKEYPIILYPDVKNTDPIGTVLFSYLKDPLTWSDNSRGFLGHGNKRMIKAIAGIFLGMGYQVEAINYYDKSFIPMKHYDVVFDIFENLGRWSESMDTSTKKILHMTGSDPVYQNTAELRRVSAVNARKKGHYSPKRMISDPYGTYHSLDIADTCILIGSEHTLRTYPKKYWHKMKLITVTGSIIADKSKKIRSHIPTQRDFLWFFGGGAVHKGLDLVLEVFARHPEYQLHVIGNVAREKDFVDLYRKELFESQNIHYHGYMYVSSKEFKSLINSIFCFIAPSCSESISSAVVTCLQLGLFPIISYDTGVVLPTGCGLYIEELSVENVEKQVQTVMRMNDKDILKQIKLIQKDAIERYSQDRFTEQMKQYLNEILHS